MTIRLLRALSAVALLVATPALLRAQSARVAIADAPSTNPETRRQQDSLIVHFIRHPKGKPAVAATRFASTRTLAGKDTTAPLGVSARVTTPLARRRTTGKAPE